ncbi:MAG TPA: hypothetical protein GXZ48_00455 [Acholeplasmataceae bacterium]|jgi:hypothetical protein|nr:hypothetical protein [Acholeplasmataceae bacterium]
MKKKVICGILIVLLVFALSLTAKTIKAWLYDTKNTEQVSFTLGKVQYTLEGSLSDDFVVPGENIVSSPYKLSNLSTITTQLRIKVIIISDSQDGSNLVESISLSENWALENDGYYYYQDDENSIIFPDNNSIVVLESLVLDGNVVNNNYSGKSVGLKLVFEAKQADYVTWEELGNININVG